jgi:hypothetical protein
MIAVAYPLNKQFTVARDRAEQRLYAGKNQWKRSRNEQAVVAGVMGFRPVPLHIGRPACTQNCL